MLNEEAYGYFDGPLVIEPEIARKARILRAEHIDLWSELESLYHQSRRVAGELAGHSARVRLMECLQSLLLRLEGHEHHENELIRLANHEDMSVAE
jgi:hypothetical protein